MKDLGNVIKGVTRQL